MSTLEKSEREIHCPNCGSIYVLDFELGDFTISKDGLILCHVCHFEIGRVTLSEKLLPHTDPFDKCDFCMDLTK